MEKLRKLHAQQRPDRHDDGVNLSWVVQRKDDFDLDENRFNDLGVCSCPANTSASCCNLVACSSMTMLWLSKTRLRPSPRGPEHLAAQQRRDGDGILNHLL